jgi:hypothetical protein
MRISTDIVILRVGRSLIRRRDGPQRPLSAREQRAARLVRGQDQQRERGVVVGEGQRGAEEVLGEARGELTRDAGGGGGGVVAIVIYGCSLSLAPLFRPHALVPGPGAARVGEEGVHGAAQRGAPEVVGDAVRGD